MVILVRKVHINVLSSNTSNMANWIMVISHFLEGHQKLIQDTMHAITPQVVAIVEEIQNRKLLAKWKINVWKFSHEEAKNFAEKLNKCVEDNLM